MKPTSLLAVLAALLLSPVAIAQSEAPVRDHPTRPAKSRSVRVVRELLMGQLALPVTFGAGALAGVLPSSLAAGAYSATGGCAGYCAPETVLVGVIAAGVISANTMTSLAVTMTGNALGGRGRYGWSTLGAGIGSTVAAAFVGGAFALTSVAYAPQRAPDNPSRILPNDGKTVSDLTAVIAVVAVATFPVVGATLGYELSSRDSNAPAATHPRSQAMHVVPTASVSSKSATLGIAGVF
jgi:hypothetical protein